MPSFVERFGLWSDDQARKADEFIKEISRRNIEVVRFAFPDQHGILRGKALVASEAVNALTAGVAITTTLFAKDTSHRTVFPVFSTGGGFNRSEMQGAADVLMVADPATFCVLPWAPHTAWLLCDVYFKSGAPVPFCSRGILRKAIELGGDLGCELMSGLEVEFHVFKVTSPSMDLDQSGQPGTPPKVSLISHGYQYLTEQRYDSVEPIMEILRKDLMALGLPVRSMEIEFGPSQIEFTFSPTIGLETANNMMLFRSAVKQICQRHGLHATFMCRPRIPNVASSGWHLHQSLISRSDGSNLFIPGAGESDLSTLGKHYLGGLLAHASGATALAAPTINAYKRYRPFSLAPDRITWGRDNRGAMIRFIGGAGDPATRLENRVGEPAANPYLYLASQLISGFDGVHRKLDPGPPADTPYETQAPVLPRTLSDAIAALREDECLRTGLGEGFVDYFCSIKEAEIARFNLEVTEWEHREYFELF